MKNTHSFYNLIIDGFKEAALLKQPKPSQKEKLNYFQRQQQPLVLVFFVVSRVDSNLHHEHIMGTSCFLSCLSKYKGTCDIKFKRCYIIRFLEGCNEAITNHLNTCPLSRETQTESQVILARAGIFDFPVSKLSETMIRRSIAIPLESTGSSGGHVSTPPTKAVKKQSRLACTKTWNAGMPECRNAGILKPGTQNY